MNLYLLEKERHPTYAILAEDENSAEKALIGILKPDPAMEGGKRDPSGYVIFKVEGYKPRIFIDGQDGEIIDKHTAFVKITYFKNPDETYFIHTRFAKELN